MKEFPKSGKIRVTPETSKIVQEILFENGKGWPEKEVQATDSPYLYWYTSSITHGTTPYTFTNHQNKEYTLADLELSGRALKTTDAQRIIDSACDSWKTTLAEKWGMSIALKAYIHVSEDFYKKMRGACTPAQNKLFDEIFGVSIKRGDYIKIGLFNDIYVAIRTSNKECMLVNPYTGLTWSGIKSSFEECVNGSEWEKVERPFK